MHKWQRAYSVFRNFASKFKGQKKSRYILINKEKFSAKKL